MGTGLLGLPLAIVALSAMSLMGPVGNQLAVNFLISLVAVVGFGIYSGNSGIMTFGHAAFMGIAAYASGLLTVSPQIKRQALPHLPAWIRDIQLPLLPAMLIAMVIVLIVAVLFGVPFSRLSAAATPIATFTMLLITFVVLAGAKDLTRGSQTFYGLPPSVDIYVALVAALLAIFVARRFRESVLGLRLQASREDELASRSMGVNVAYLRMIAWVLSALVVAVAGVLLGHELTAFSPKQFYISLQFMLVAMLVVGGQATVTGAVVGTFLVSLLMEGARRLETYLNGLTIAGFTIQNVFGLQEIVLGLLIIAVMFWRRDGLFDFDELDEKLRLLKMRRAARAQQRLAKQDPSNREPGGPSGRPGTSDQVDAATRS
ncbi:MAG TPA: branched-chain amino acid ABC transporter permease [Jiangellales bacterium]|nr:branched-chain amino acid ABC transporter permease [Jiangellales bacterium]